MRRFIALIIMLIIPLQSAWSAASGLYGHMDENVAVAGFHTHEHDHYDSAHSDHKVVVAIGDMGNSQNEDGHHDDGHCHHAFSPMLLEACLNFVVATSSGLVPNPHAAFFSRTLTPLDRPPLAFA